MTTRKPKRPSMVESLIASFATIAADQPATVRQPSRPERENDEPG